MQPPVHLADFDKTKDLKGIRIGIYDQYFNDANPEIVEACRKSLADLKARGAKVKNITIPYLQVLDRAHKVTIMSEFALNLIAFVRLYPTLATTFAYNAFCVVGIRLLSHWR